MIEAIDFRSDEVLGDPDFVDEETLAATDLAADQIVRLDTASWTYQFSVLQLTRHGVEGVLTRTQTTDSTPIKSEVMKAALQNSHSFERGYGAIFALENDKIIITSPVNRLTRAA